MVGIKSGGIFLRRGISSYLNVFNKNIKNALIDNPQIPEQVLVNINHLEIERKGEIAFNRGFEPFLFKLQGRSIFKIKSSVQIKK